MDETKLSCLVRVGGVNTTADKTRQFCLVRVGGVNTIADQTRQFCLVRVGGVNNLFVANWELGRDDIKLIETGSRQNCLVGGVNKPQHTVPHTAACSNKTLITFTFQQPTTGECS